MNDKFDTPEQRLKRIETVLYLLCRHLGLDPRTGDRLTDKAPHPGTKDTQ